MSLSFAWCNGMNDKMLGLCMLFNAEPEMITEMFILWCNLKEYKPAKSIIDLMIDDATNVWSDRMNEFAHDVDDLIFQRLEVA